MPPLDAWTPRFTPSSELVLDDKIFWVSESLVDFGDVTSPA